MNLTVIQVLEVLVLLTVANGGPVMATRLLGNRWGRPLDGGRRAWDGRPWFGVSKTVRGIVVGVMATALVAALMGLGWRLGLVFGAASMAGDLFSSFFKRRLGIESSGQAMGLDQVPEALFPLLACYRPLGLEPAGVLLLVALFAVAQIVVSPVMYLLGIRRRPY
jgi:CDP-2,3-bis-(O-geranylgeranyl)-sn-glycerol synthase